MKLLFTGDVVISNLDSASSLLGDKLRGLTDDVDFKCCNFEAPIMEGNEAPKVGPHNHNCLATIDCLIKEGFNLFALANNHIYDYGARGLEKTKEAIISRGGGIQAQE